MYYLVYQITNKINNKIYIGVHKTNNLDDGYMGSGTYIKRAITKYGIENFSKIILFEAESSEEMFQKESELVEIGDHSYNLKKGGEGGFDYINSNGLNIVFMKQRELDPTLLQRCIDKSKIAHQKWREKVGKEKISEFGRIGGLKNIELHGSSFSYLNKDPEFQKKRKDTFAITGHAQGSKNSQFGTMWITNGSENKKIKKDDSIPEGWMKGRKIK